MRTGVVSTRCGAAVDVTEGVVMTSG